MNTYRRVAWPSMFMDRLQLSRLKDLSDDLHHVCMFKPIYMVQVCGRCNIHNPGCRVHVRLELEGEGRERERL